ncbi:uncharacterized protein F54H12.2-like [Leptopilina heterotoma]|uniref:uncharacterized protein F54H12.2-like n=1 Tax=Leptopilina heterotoma TaxID=63436 RepID=UPI001CA8980D|nr:uncharacterized protein F54H12.2-like [Leptopilina heterotoma]
MSFLHSHSCECLKSELDLFTLQPTQTAIESSQWVYYKPVSFLTDDSPIEFVVPGHGDEYIDLPHTMISLKVRLIVPARTAENADNISKIGPVNNLLHSMFNQIDVYFNQKLVSPPNNAYAYRAYIETLLNYNNVAKTTHLTSSLWSNDTAGKMEEFGDENKGLVERRKYLSDSRIIDMVGHLHCDVFNQDKFLLNGVELRLRLVRSKDAFCLIDPTGVSPLHIEEASLLVRRAKISPGVLIGHAKTLSSGTAKYPITRVEVKALSLHAGIHSETFDNVILGQLPKRIIIGFVDNTAFNGSRNKNPFNFKHYQINHFSLYVDGMQIPSKPLLTDFSKDKLYVEAYQTLFTGTGIHFLNEGNNINRFDYANGYCLFAFDLTPDLSAHCFSHWNLIKHGALRIELRFEEMLQETINCIVYAEYDNVLKIDASRQVITDFGA